MTLIRRALAAVLDLLLLSALQVGTGKIQAAAGGKLVLQFSDAEVLCFLLYFVLFPWLTAGRTPGQMLLKIRVVRTSSQVKPSLPQLLVRNLLLYVLEPLLTVLAAAMLGAMIILLTSNGVEPVAFIILFTGCTAVLLAIVWFFLHCQLKWNTFPHGHFSHTMVVKEKEKAV